MAGLVEETILVDLGGLVVSFWGTPGDRDGKLGPWNTVKLNGRIFPNADGYDDPKACGVEVASGGVGYAINKVKNKGQSGHKLVAEGYLPEPITLNVYFWRPEQWAAYLGLLSDINPKIKANRLRSYKLEYTELAALQVTDVVIHHIGVSRPTGEWGVRTVPIKMEEVFDQNKDAVKPVAAVDLNTDGRVALDPKFKLDENP